jgi:hypothetical protein
MDPMQILNQTFLSRQASWDKMFYNLTEEEVENAEEWVYDDDENDVAAPVTTTTPPAGEVATTTDPTTVETTQAPGKTEAPAAPTATTDPLTPTDTVAPGGNVQGQDGLVECPELFKELVSVLDEKGKSDMSFPNLKRALEKKGLEVNITGGEMLNTGKENTEDLQINATLEVIGKDGKRLVFQDTNGDGGIGVTDKGFADAVQKYVPEKAAHLQQGKSDQRQNVALRAQGQKVPEARKKAMEANFSAGGGGETTAAAAAPAAEAKTAAPAAAEAVTPTAAVQAAPQAAPKTTAPDPLAAISSRISSSDQQLNSKGQPYKYQVQDTDLNKCPRGKKQCNGCGQCIKAEVREAQKNGASATDNQNVETEDTAEVTAAAEVQTAEQQTAQQAGVPEHNVSTTTEAVEEQDASEALKQIQAHLDSYGFVDKTAEELLADGQLEQLALQLGIHLPDSIYK